MEGQRMHDFQIDLEIDIILFPIKNWVIFLLISFQFHEQKYDPKTLKTQ